MKKVLFTAFAAILATVLSAAEFPVEPPGVQLQKEYLSGDMIGKSSHSGVIGGQIYPEVWSYYSLESGSTPETFQYRPLNALDPKSSVGKAWKTCPLLSSDPEGKKLSYPALLRTDFHVDRKASYRGGAFVFNSPFKEKVHLIVEGNLNVRQGAEAVVYRQSADGRISVMGGSHLPDSRHEMSNRFPDGIRIRHYVKLQCETDLQPGDRVCFAVFLLQTDPAKKKESVLFSVDDRWGKSWNPIFIIEK